MPRINVLAYECGGIPRMLSSDAEIADAVVRGDIAPDTSVTLYMDDGERRFGPANTHPELSAHFATSDSAMAAASTDPTPALPAIEVPFVAAERASPWTVQKVSSAAETREVMPTAVSNAGFSPAPRALERTLFPPSVPVASRGAAANAAATQSIWTYMFLPYRRYAEFEGRASRKEFWAFSLFALVVIVVLSLNLAIVGRGNGPVLLLLFCMGSFIPALAVQIRRLHDIGVTGWAVLLSFIPYVGTIIVLILMLIESNRGANRFGPDPKSAMTASRSS